MREEHGFEPMPPRRRRRLQLLVGRTAGAVLGALAGGAIAIGSGLSPTTTTLLGLAGATLGAVAATADRRKADPAVRPMPRPAVSAGGDTPPEGFRLRS